MKQQRFAIFAVLTGAICLTGLFVLVWNLAKPVADVYLIPRSIQTNSTGTLCMLIAVTNRSNRTYGVAFATETKPSGGWADPSRVKQHFGVCPGETLEPTSGTEVLVPVPQTRLPWRVTAAYFAKDEKIPSGLGRYWKSVRMRWNPGHYLKHVTTSEISSNQRIEPMTRSAVSLLFRSDATNALLVMAHPCRSLEKP
jgi:hypothetical protein